MSEKIKEVLITIPLEPHHMDKMKKNLGDAKIICCDSKDADAIKNALKSVDVALISTNVDERFYKAPNLKWVHADAAGLDSSAKSALFETNLKVTGSAGRSAPALAEHTLFFMMNFAYKIRAILKAQNEKKWGYEKQIETAALFSQTIGILGFGNTGIALAKRAKALEMRVLAYKRSKVECPEYVDHMYSKEDGDTIEEIIRESDFIVIATPLNNDTYHMIDENMINIMKKSAVIVNLGRGACIDEKALIKALKSNRIAGAGLDTFETEPLPADSELWTLENVIVTPHFTPPCPDKVGRSLDIVIENVKRYQKGEALINQITKADIFEIS